MYLAYTSYVHRAKSSSVLSCALHLKVTVVVCFLHVLSHTNPVPRSLSLDIYVSAWPSYPSANDKLSSQLLALRVVLYASADPCFICWPVYWCKHLSHMLSCILVHTLVLCHLYLACTQGSGVTLSSAWQAVKAGLSPHVLSNFLVLGLPGGVMMAADACSFDVTTVMASILGMHSHLMTYSACYAYSFCHSTWV